MAASIRYGNAGAEHVLVLDQSDVVIGTTSTATIRTSDTTVTRRHARIVLDGEHYRVEDLGSDNGTYVNGARVHRHVLRDGDRLQCGGLKLVFCESEPRPHDAPNGKPPCSTS